MYTVGEMAKMLGVPASTLRYYDKEGLLPFVELSAGGLRMSLRDIRQYMELVIQGDDTIDARLEMFRRQRKTLETQMAELQHTMDMVDYKCWYYETAQKTGTIETPKNLPLEQVPEPLRAIRLELNQPPEK